MSMIAELQRRRVVRTSESAAATAQLVRLDPYCIVGRMRRRDAVAALDDRAEVQHVIDRLREPDPDNAYSPGPLDLTCFFSRMYVSKPAGWRMLGDPRVKQRLADCGFVRYWREKGWPAGCRPPGETDFECGIDATGAEKR